MRIQHPAADEGKKIVVIVGSGFAGLNAAKALSHLKEATVKGFGRDVHLGLELSAL